MSMRKTYCHAALTVGDTTLSWQDNEINAGTLTETVDKSIKSIPINKLNLTVIDADEDFDISNPDGLWTELEYDQVITVSEYVDGDTIDLGTFYLDGWSFKNNLATFSAVDAFGYIQRRSFSGKFYLNTAAGDILDDIMEAAEYEDYAIDDDLASTTLSGYLPASDCREALRCLCLALGAYANCNRSATISVSQSTRYISTYIDIDRKLYGNTQANLKEAVAEVDFTIPVYTADTEESTLYEGTLPAGTSVVSFDDPYVDGTLSVTTEDGEVVIVVETGSGFELTLTDEDTVTITAIKYTSNNLTIAKTTDVETYANFPETESYTCPLYNMGNIGAIVYSLLTYYQLRKELNMKFILNEEQAGDWIGVTDRNGNSSTVFIEEQTIDLVGGFISTASCVGYASDMMAYYYAGSELVSASNFII